MDDWGGGVIILGFCISVYEEKTLIGCVLALILTIAVFEVLL